jgi:hypothetical protein
MLHRSDQSGNTNAACDLCNNSGPLRHFSDHIRRESGPVETANQLIIEYRIRFARRQYSPFVP